MSGCLRSGKKIVFLVCSGMILSLLLAFRFVPSQTYALAWTSTPVPTITPSATMPPASTYEGKASLLIGDAVLPLQGNKRVQVFVALRDVRPGICGLTLHLTFDPTIAQVIDADQNAENGIQVEADVTWLSGYVEDNQVDNLAGEIHLAVTQADCVPLTDTAGWRPFAVIAWQGVGEGQFSLATGPKTEFTLDSGARVSPNQIDAGTVSVRAQGQIQGSVFLQGRSVHRDIVVSAKLATEPGDRTVTVSDGVFSLLTSQGEGFYTLTASRVGYLSAQSSTPIQVTLGRSVAVAPVVLLGGDVNNDGSIDVRDLAFIAWHFDQYDAAADINDDGEVDISDLTITAGNYGQRGPTAWPIVKP